MCNSFSKLIMDALRDHSKISMFNGTLITLIPKVDPVCCIKNFRPISLCNVSYKTLTKLLANRLRPVMASLVSPCQNSFIPKRQSRDNIVVTQEMIHSMRSRRTGKGWMVIKIDL